MEDTIIEYKPVTYNKFVLELSKQYTDYKAQNNKSEIDLAIKLKISHMSVRNCFKKNSQYVSDKALTILMKHIGMKAKIEWVDGIRNYYIENIEGKNFGDVS